VISQANDIKKLKQSNDKNLHSDIVVRKKYDDSIFISSTRKNKQLVGADFILWDECTLMFWIFVPPQGQGLRDSNTNRCLFSHTTGHNEKWNNFNGFTLRHNEKREWHFSFTNDKANYPPKPMIIEDGLEAGWHQIIIAWNKLLPELQFLIDKGIGGNARSPIFLSFWPERTAANVTIGAWETGDPKSYCETKLLSLWICNKYLPIDSELVNAHFSLKPA
jgi:hypothetical protein